MVQERIFRPAAYQTTPYRRCLLSHPPSPVPVDQLRADLCLAGAADGVINRDGLGLEAFEDALHLWVIVDSEDGAPLYMKQQIAIMRPKLRRNDNPSWRNEHYAGIYARARQLGISKGEVYAIAFNRLGVQVVSLTKLGEQNLKKLYQIIMAM
jgi:hypothetical protein